MAKQGLTVLGTNTAVGKTTVSCALLRTLRARGVTPIPLKPMESGYREEDSDVAKLLEASGRLDLSVADCSAYQFAMPVAPLVAARMAGKKIQLAELVSFVEDKSQGGGFPVIELAGGVLCPMGEQFTALDLAVAIGYPILLVAENCLGTVSITALAISAIRQRAVDVIGVVLSTIQPMVTADQPYNAALIEELTQTKVLGVLPNQISLKSSDKVAESILNVCCFCPK